METAEWFSNTHPYAKSWNDVTALQRERMALEVYRLLTIDWKSSDGGRSRLRAILDYAIADIDFWQRNLRSLASLRRDKGNGPKWQSIELAMQKHYDDERAGRQAQRRRRYDEDDGDNWSRPIRYLKDAK